jgi:hypothetical protein
MGANFVGFRVLSDRIRVRNDNLRRSRRRLQQLKSGYLNGEIDSQQLHQSAILIMTFSLPQL